MKIAFMMRREPIVPRLRVPARPVSSEFPSANP